MTSPIPDILIKIIKQKKIEIALHKNKTSESELRGATTHTPYDFAQALRTKIQLKQPAIIAEIKKASPSKGIIREHFNPVECATQYVAAGASCISVLTDETFFQGSNSDLIQVRKVCELPILRKDFIIDSYQIYETKAIGADCILLIASALDDMQLKDFHDLAIELQLQILIEIHDLSELERALQLTTPLIGINNRDLRSFITTKTTTIDLYAKVPDNRILITESGISSVADMQFMQQHGINCFLIGEAFMRHPHPGTKLAEFMRAG